MRTAIFGAGSIGMIVGALVTKNGGQIDLIDSFVDNVNKLNKSGAIITGGIEVRQLVTALTPQQMTGVYDLVLISTKQTQNRIVLPQIQKHIGSESLVLTLQNGIPEEEVAGYVGKERTAGGAVGFGATWIAPGISMLTSPESGLEFSFEIGELDGAVTPRIQRAKELLDLCGGCVIQENLPGVRWTKVLINSAFSGMSAALGCTYGDILADDDALYCIAHIIDEVIKVARAEGVTLVHMLGYDFGWLELVPGADMGERLDFFHKVWDPHAELKASMLQDLEKQQATEIDYINGHVCKKGRQHGIPTPFNDKVVELVKAEEKEKRVNTTEALSGFDLLLKAAAR